MDPPRGNSHFGVAVRPLTVTAAPTLGVNELHMRRP